jgi:hypothetical protein
MDRNRWRPVVERFIADLRSFRADADEPSNNPARRGPLDVRENVRFRGGYFPRWIHETFPRNGCALAVEVKKFFMDEWTGQPDPAQIEWVRQALASTLPGVLEALESCPTASSPKRPISND